MKQSAFGVTSLVIGIISLVFSCFGIGFLGALGFIFAIIAFIQKDRGKGTAIAGLITSIIGFLISFFVVLVGFSMFNNETEKETSNIESVQDDNNSEKSKSTIYKDDDYTYEIKKYDIKKIDGISCILIYSDFTNNSDNSASADDNMLLRAFQDGVELERVYDSSYSDETKNYEKNIKPGKTIEICEVYQLSNKKSDVELEITNAFLIGGDIAKGTIKLYENSKEDETE